MVIFIFLLSKIVIDPTTSLSLSVQLCYYPSVEVLSTLTWLKNVELKHGKRIGASEYVFWCWISSDCLFKPSLFLFSCHDKRSQTETHGMCQEREQEYQEGRGKH